MKSYLLIGTLVFVFSPGVVLAQNPTFNKNVLPILQQNCQVCHRAGEIGPMPFSTYEATRPWARAIKAAVVSKKMPPWFADPRFGKFANNPSLSPSDVKTLVPQGAGVGKI